MPSYAIPFYTMYTCKLDGEDWFLHWLEPATAEPELAGVPPCTEPPSVELSIIISVLSLNQDSTPVLSCYFAPAQDGRKSHKDSFISLFLCPNEGYPLRIAPREPRFRRQKPPKVAPSCIINKKYSSRTYTLPLANFVLAGGNNHSGPHSIGILYR